MTLCNAFALSPAPLGAQRHTAVRQPTCPLTRPSTAAPSGRARVAGPGRFRRAMVTNLSGQAAAAAAAAGVPRVLITGAPASGKGTQCALIVSKFGPVHISTGDLLRAATSDPNSELGKQASEFMTQGKLVPDELVIELLLARLAQDDVVAKGWLLDGFPRTSAQADFLDSKNIVPDVVVALDVADETVVKRIAGRRTDPVTGTIYHVDFEPATDKEVIERLVQRSDDTEEKVKVRLGLYHEYAEAILDKYSSKVVTVDGERSKEQVFGDVQTAIAGSLKRSDSGKKKPMTVNEFVQKAEEAFENGSDLGVADINWSGQAGLSGPLEKGESNYSDLGRRPGLVAGDITALLAFAAIGKASHGLPVIDIGLLKTVAPFIIGWLAVAPMLGGYTARATESWSQMARTTLACWAVGIPLGLTVRGLSVSHVPSSSFATVTLVTTLVLLLSSRSLYLGINGVSVVEGKRGGLLDGFRMVTTLLKRW